MNYRDNKDSQGFERGIIIDRITDFLKRNMRYISKGDLPGFMQNSAF